METSELYWILQLDEIKFLLQGPINILWILGLAGLCLLVAALFEARRLIAAISVSIITGLLFMFLITIWIMSVFIPSSKNMAVIHILPKIVNNEELKVEAIELYDLAKQGLKDLVTKDSKEGVK